MKKFLAVLVTVILTVSLAVTASAGESNWTKYPFFTNEGVITEGVSFWINNTTPVTSEQFNAMIGQGWDGNTVKSADGAYLFITWWNLGWINDNYGDSDIKTGAHISQNHDGFVKIVFTGTAFRVSTYDTGNYAGSKLTVTVDGVAQEVDYSLTNNAPCPSNIFTITGLENKTHTVILGCSEGEMPMHYFEIDGTLGGSPETGSYTVAAAIVAVAAVASIAVVSKKHH